MFVQMRSPFSGKWLKIEIEDGRIAEFGDAAWPDITHVSSTIAAATDDEPATTPVSGDRRRERGRTVIGALAQPAQRAFPFRP